MRTVLKREEKDILLLFIAYNSGGVYGFKTS